MTDIIRLDAATLAAKIAAKELSSTEVTQACLDQIEQTDERYHAFLHVAADQALADAARVDAAVAAGEELASSALEEHLPQAPAPAPAAQTPAAPRETPPKLLH